MYLLGYDIGTSSVKACLVEAETGKVVANDYFPKVELGIESPRQGWAEQNPEIWWECVISVTRKLLSDSGIDKNDIKAIGISYQMHGLVLVDEKQEVLRPSIIWCDSRAVEIGNKAFDQIGSEKCLSHLLNSPGNFTASKLKWVKENEPEIYSKIYKVMLPGDFIAMKMTGRICTSITGLSEGIFWDFKNEKPADIILDHYGFFNEILPEYVPVFSKQGNITSKSAHELGLSQGTEVTYRSGDQPNNAFSLNVVNPGEVAASAGTSGVIYGITDKVVYDKQSRVNTFAHVNYTEENKRLGVLLCINGTGIANNWIKNILMTGRQSISYDQMNELGLQSPQGSEGLQFFPYGNGAERSLGNREVNASFHGLSFNRHKLSHLLRSVQEGIVFSMNYGLDIMKSMGMAINTVNVGMGNMFLSSIFREAFASTTGCKVKLFNTDGAQGAARGAGIGAKIYKNNQEAFEGVQAKMVVHPSGELRNIYKEAYLNWVSQLNIILDREKSDFQK